MPLIMGPPPNTGPALTSSFDIGGTPGNPTTGTTKTITSTLGKQSPYGKNALIACVGVWSRTVTVAAPTSVKLGTTSMSLAVGYQPENAGWVGIYYLSNIAAAQTSVAVTTASYANSACSVGIMELTQMAPSSMFDAASPGTATETSAWSSGAVTTTQAVEIVVGAAWCWNASALTLVGPGSPWVTATQLNETEDSNTVSLLFGYQLTSVTGSYTFSGTGGGTSLWNTAIAASFFTAPATDQCLVSASSMRSALW